MEPLGMTYSRDFYKGKEKEKPKKADEGTRFHQAIDKILTGSGTIETKLKKMADFEKNLRLEEFAQHVQMGEIDFIVKQTNPDKKQFAIYLLKENYSDIEKIDIQFTKNKVYDLKTRKPLSTQELADLMTLAQERADQVR